MPPSPHNVSVRWRGNSLLVSWFPPPARSSPVMIGCYLVEYRTLGQWVPLAERVAASERPGYRWTTASRSATYQFRVFSVGAPCRPDLTPLLSRPSAVVSFHTSGSVLHTSGRPFIEGGGGVIVWASLKSSEYLLPATLIVHVKQSVRCVCSEDNFQLFLT